MIWNLTRKILFLLDPEWAHAIGAFFLRLRGFFTGGKPKVVRWTRREKPTLAGIRLDSPLGVAAGFDKDGQLIQGLRSLGFGFVEVGTVTPLPQKGNPKPRLFRLPEAEALVNRMGFNSQGALAVADRISNLRAMHSIRFPIGINLGKNRDTPLEEAAEDYVKAMEILYSVSDYLVINLSSPNTPGLTTLQEGKNLSPLLARVREKRDALARTKPGISRPLFLKISPDLQVSDRETAVKTAMEQGFEGIIASNTSRRRDFALLSKAKASDVAEEGGLSGAPLRELALEQIGQIRQWMAKDKVFISVGGLGDEKDALLRREAGANLLQVYTNFVYQGPSYPLRIAKAMARP